MFRKKPRNRPMTIDDKAGYVLGILAMYFLIWLFVLMIFIGASAWLFNSGISVVPWVTTTIALAWFGIPFYLIYDGRK